MGRTKRGAAATNPPPQSSAAVPPPESDPPAISSTRPPNIEWSKNPDWTWSLVAYLTTHSAFRTKLFSDSTADATKNGRAKVVGKEGKSQMYGTLAKALFGEMAGQMEFYALDPKRFAISVETRLRRLKSEYTKHLKELGSTGAGLSPEDVTPGSELANLVDRICSTWPWWKEFHSFWRKLPNYNPISVTTSTPGLDHAAEASMLFEATPALDRDTSPAADDLDINREGHQADTTASSDLDMDGEKGNEDEDVEEEDELISNWAPTPPPAVNIPLPPVEASKPIPPPVKSMRTKAPKIIQDSKAVASLGGRDAGLAKANASVSKHTPKTTPLERFNENRTNETARLSRKHERDHELKLVQAQNKRYKYEFKYGAPQRVAKAQLQAAETERQTRIEELKLQIELARIQAAATPIQQPPLRPPLVSYNANAVAADVHPPLAEAVPYIDASQNGAYSSDDMNMFAASSSSSMDGYYNMFNASA